MDFNIDVRKKQLQSLDQYITSSKAKVDSILDYFGWTEKKVLVAEDKLACLLNSSHKVPTKKLEKHIRKCCLQSAGYDLDEHFLSESIYYSRSSIALDNPKKFEVLSQARNGNPKFQTAWNGVDPDPLTSNRLMSTFSSDERLALYDYCVKHTEPPPTPSEFNINIVEQDKTEIVSHEEQLQRERNAKRRRIKYKSVHTGRNKNYTEVIKEVIDNQMELYKEYLVSNEEVIKPCEHVAQDPPHQSYSNTNNGVDYVKEIFDAYDRPCSSGGRHSTHSENSYSTGKRGYGYRGERKSESNDYSERTKDRKSHRDYEDRREHRDKYKSSRKYRTENKHDRRHESNYGKYSRERNEYHHRRRY